MCTAPLISTTVVRYSCYIFLPKVGALSEALLGLTWREKEGPSPFLAESQSYDHTPSHPYDAGTENVGFHRPGRYRAHQGGGAGVQLLRLVRARARFGRVPGEIA